MRSSFLPITRLPGSRSLQEELDGSCRSAFSAHCPGTPRVPSTLLCYTFPVAKVQPRRRDLCCQVSASTGTAEQAREGKRLLSRSVVARSAKDTSDGFVGHAVISGNLAQGFVIFNDPPYHVWPFFHWDAMVRLTWT